MRIPAREALAEVQRALEPIGDDFVATFLPDSTIDVHDAMVRAIERELELRFSGNSVLNRLEAEAQLAALLRDRRDSDESRKTREPHHDVRGA